MPTVESPEKLQFAVAFLLPGFIVSYIYTQFIGGQKKSPFNEILQYIALSALYFGLIFPFSTWVDAGKLASGGAFLAFGFFVLGPLMLGVSLGLLAQKSVPQWIFRTIGVGIVHPIPTAWDWRFGDFKENTFVLVTLDDGSKVAGLLDQAAFASSDPQERDVYIDDVWDYDEGSWTPRPERQGILIFRSEIRYIEFWNPGRETRDGSRGQGTASKTVD